MLAAFKQGRDVVAKVRAVAHEPLHPVAKAVEVGDLRRVDRRDGEQGNEPDHAADAHAERLAVRDAEQVVVEAVLLVP